MYGLKYTASWHMTWNQKSVVHTYNSAIFVSFMNIFVFVEFVIIYKSQQSGSSLLNSTLKARALTGSPFGVDARFRSGLE